MYHMNLLLTNQKFFSTIIWNIKHIITTCDVRIRPYIRTPLEETWNVGLCIAYIVQLCIGVTSKKNVIYQCFLLTRNKIS